GQARGKLLQPAGRGNRVGGEHHHVGITAGLQRLVEVRDLADAALPAAVVGGQCGALQPALHDRQPARAGPGVVGQPHAGARGRAGVQRREAGVQRFVVAAQRQQHDRQRGRGRRRPGHCRGGSRYSGSIALNRRPYSSVSARASSGLRTICGVSSTITSLRVLFWWLEPNSEPTSGIRLSHGTPEEPCSAPWLIRPASITVSPLRTAASVFSRRVLIGTLQLAALAAQLAGTAPGELTSWTMSRNTMPSRVTRGRTLRITPVSRYWTWL